MNITVYHGSSVYFSSVDFSVLGVGDGSASYGFGFYVTPNVEVAKSYATAGAGPMGKITPRDGCVLKTTVALDPHKVIDMDQGPPPASFVNRLANLLVDHDQADLAVSITRKPFTCALALYDYLSEVFSKRTASALFLHAGADCLRYDGGNVNVILNTDTIREPLTVHQKIGADLNAAPTASGKKPDNGRFWNDCLARAKDQSWIAAPYLEEKATELKREAAYQGAYDNSKEKRDISRKIDNLQPGFSIYYMDRLQEARPFSDIYRSFIDRGVQEIRSGADRQRSAFLGQIQSGTPADQSATYSSANLFPETGHARGITLPEKASADLHRKTDKLITALNTLHAETGQVSGRLRDCLASNTARLANPPDNPHYQQDIWRDDLTRFGHARDQLNGADYLRTEMITLLLSKTPAAKAAGESMREFLDAFSKAEGVSPYAAQALGDKAVDVEGTVKALRLAAKEPQNPVAPATTRHPVGAARNTFKLS